jgi:hypothetical protein
MRGGLYALLQDKHEWDDQTWFWVERYLCSAVATDQAFELLSIAGIDSVTSLHKVDQLRQFRIAPPDALLVAWTNWQQPDGYSSTESPLRRSA